MPRKSEHTPEPWVAYHRDPKYPGDHSRVIGQQRTLLLLPTPGNPKERGEFEANLDRVVECVNALAGIPAGLVESVLTRVRVEAAQLIDLAEGKPMPVDDREAYQAVVIANLRGALARLK